MNADSLSGTAEHLGVSGTYDRLDAAGVSALSVLQVLRGGAVVDDGPRSSSVVHSVRMSNALTERLFAEAERCGTTPSELIRQAVESRLDASRRSETVTIDVAARYQAIDQAAPGRTPGGIRTLSR